MSLVPCPCNRTDAVGELVPFDFASTTVEVLPCPTCRDAGVSSFTCRKSWALANALPTVIGSRHVDGLVTLGAI